MKDLGGISCKSQRLFISCIKYGKSDSETIVLFYLQPGLPTVPLKIRSIKMGNLLMCQMFRVKSHPVVVTFTACLSGGE